MRPPTAPPASADVRLRFVVIGAVPEAPLEKLACLGSVQRAADIATAGAALSADPAWTAILVLGPDVDSHEI